jgi:cytochrome c peroxidase
MLLSRTLPGSTKAPSAALWLQPHYFLILGFEKNDEDEKVAQCIGCFVDWHFVVCGMQEKRRHTTEKRIPILPDEPYDYATPPNETFFSPFGDSVINNDIATLGRVLFYDVNLSRNHRVSCGTCHRQINGFADNRNFSFGLLDSLTGRNTQTIVNTGTQFGFFWDLRESTLDHMVLQPIANHIEMGIADTLVVEERVRKIDYYKPLFVKAFGSEEVTSNKIGRALAQFVKSIVSVSTKYDAGRMMQPNPAVQSKQF